LLTKSVLRLVDVSDRGQIRRLQFWMKTSHVIFGADRVEIIAFDFVIAQYVIAPSNKAAALYAFPISIILQRRQKLPILIKLQRSLSNLLLLMLHNRLRCLKNVSVVRLVDESDRGQIRRFRFWL
jgi:hypothetical protein